MRLDQIKMNKQAGFTFIELMVSIAILVLLVSIVVANFQGTQVSAHRNVFLASNNLVSDLHKLQSFSLSSRNVTVSGGQINPAAAYIASFSTGGTGYSLTDTDNQGNNGSISTPNFPPNINIGAIQITTPISSSSPSQVSVSFSVPYSRISATYTGLTTPELNDIVRLQIQSTVASGVCEYVFINGITGNISTNTTCP